MYIELFLRYCSSDKKKILMLGNVSSKDEYKNYREYLNLPDQHGYVPLHHAAASGSYKVSLWYSDYCMEHHML